MSTSRWPTSETVLGETDIRTGMALMQTIYVVAMTLGFKEVVEAAYGVFVPPTSSKPGGLQISVAVLALLSIVLLTIRFFWVPRNLYAYVVSKLEENRRESDRRESVFTRVMIVHFPIVLAHSLLFAMVCRAFVDLIAPAEHKVHASHADLAFRFVSLYAGLLLLNAVWLLVITQSDDREPSTRWAYNNLVCVLLAVGAIDAFEKHELSTSLLIGVASVLYLGNGLLDLVKTAPYYILFEHKRRVPDPMLVVLDDPPTSLSPSGGTTSSTPTRAP